MTTKVSIIFGIPRNFWDYFRYFFNYCNLSVEMFANTKNNSYSLRLFQQFSLSLHIHKRKKYEPVKIDLKVGSVEEKNYLCTQTYILDKRAIQAFRSP